MTATTARPPVPKRTQILYGFGSVAYGIKDSGFSTLLLLFYNQVIGLPAELVGLAIGIALIMDAFIDPIIGNISDNIDTRWGRRHPFMYGCILPVMLGYLLLWFPPEGSDMLRFWYLLGIAFVVRASISCFEIPAAALVPELTRDYDERTSITAWRYFFGWIGGLLMLIFTFSFLLVKTSEYPVPMANRDGYSAYAFIAAAMMGFSVLVAALATHSRIPTFPKQKDHGETILQSFRAVFGIFRNKAFGILILGGVFAYTIQGIGLALFPYLYGYYWNFAQWQTSLYLIVLLFAAGAASYVAPIVSKKLGKRRTLVTFTLASATLSSSVYFLSWLGFFPERGSPLLMPVLFTIVGAGTASNIVGFIIGASIMADVVEDSEEKTGRRSEGLFFAGNFFMQKCTTGIGLSVAGVILALVGFPEKADPATLGDDVRERLAITYAILVLVIGYAAAFVFSFHPHSREAHEARVARLAEAGGGAPLQG